MARKLRVQYPGAIYHVMNRADRREPIFKDDTDRAPLSWRPWASEFVSKVWTDPFSGYRGPRGHETVFEFDPVGFFGVTRPIRWEHDTILRCRINAAFRSQVERRIYAAEGVPEEICPAPKSCSV